MARGRIARGAVLLRRARRRRRSRAPVGDVAARVVSAATYAVLGGTPSIAVTTPAPGYSGYYAYGTASFGPAVVNPGAFGVMAVVPADGAGCAAFSAATAAAVAGKIAIIDRVLDPASGTFGLRLEMRNPKGAVLAGVRCKVAFESLTLPAAAKAGEDGREAEVRAGRPATAPRPITNAPAAR